MNEDALSRAQYLSDQDLVTRVKLLAQQERAATAVLVAHLAILDERRLYLAEGFASLFTYCTQVLHLAEHAAYNRIEAARAARKLPVVLEMLEDGSVTLTTVRLLAPHLTPANHGDLLAAARYMSKRQVEELVAQLHPQPSVTSSIRRLPMSIHESSSTTSATTKWIEGPGSPPDGLRQPAVAPSIPTPPARPPVVEPLGSRRYRVQFTASTATCDKLRLAQDLLRHQIPDGDLGEIMDRALTLLLGTLARQKFAATDRPRQRPASGNDGPTGSRHIPAEVRRTVWLRDGGRCAFVASTGRRCGERGFLEFHHVVPYGAGGAATSDNIQLRCRAHNGYEATLYFAESTSRFVNPKAAMVKEHGANYWVLTAQKQQRLRQRMAPSPRAGPGPGPAGQLSPDC